jgi:type I restriction enzyme, S subunit
MNYEVLSDVAKIIMGQSPPSSTYNTTGKGLAFFQGKADFGEMYPTPRVYCSEPNRIAEPGDILITVRAPVGPTNINVVQSCIGRGLAAIRASKSVDRDYLLYFLRFYEPELAKAGTGSTFAAISREDIETVKIPLPPLPEQRRIAGLLSRADHLRRLRRVGDTLSASLLQSVFLEMFGDPVRNEKSWDKEILEDLGKVTTGSTPPTKNEGMFGGLIPFITPGDLDVDTLKSKRYVTEEGAKKSRVVRAGSTLVCCIGATIGKTDKAQTKCAFNQQINAIEWGKRINDDYGVTVMRFFSGIVASRGSSTTLPILKKSEFEEIAIPVPPLPEQKQFAAVVRRVESLRGRQAESARQGEGLFQSLLSQSFGMA